MTYPGHIYEPLVEGVFAALEPQHNIRFPFWDAMILWSTSKLRCAMYSEDLKGSIIAGVRVVNPLERSEENV